MITYRRHGRTLFKCVIKLAHEKIGEVVVETRDISETGVFIKSKALADIITVGDEITVEASTGNKIPSQLTAVRLTDEGVGFVYG